jgi:nitrite reductase/ring-hydroxylating ferredoxin subunit
MSIADSTLDAPVATVNINDLRVTQVPVKGFRNYWYPVMFAGSLGERPLARQILGEEILFVREDGRASAIQARCPHRGAPLVKGMSLAPGLITCPYHGFTFDTKTGECVAALTEGPNSACVGKLKARTYPVEERCGLIWVFVGEGEPPPLEEDMPEEFLDPGAVVVGRFSVWKTNWRVSVDNGADVAHVPFLHRKHPYVRFKLLPSFFKVSTRREGKWLRVVLDELGFEATYPRIGHWPNDLSFRRRMGPAQTSVRLPGIVRIVFPGRYAHLRWSIAINENETLIFQSLVKPTSGFGAIRFKLFYHLWEKWMYHVSFQEDDQDVLTHIDRLAPEHLTQSDAIIVQWRRMAREARMSCIAATVASVSAGSTGDRSAK